MSFAPFDTDMVVARVARQVPELQLVGGAADYAAVKELRSFRTPSAYVVFADEENTGTLPTTFCSTQVATTVQFGVVLALRHYRETRGEQMQDDMRALVGQVRAALIGHKPRKDIGAIGWQSGKVLDYDAGVLLFADVYELRHVMHRDEVAPCTAGA